MLKKRYEKVMSAAEEIAKDHVSAYAAQSAFFFMICMIPILLLLLTLIQYTPVTKADFMEAVVKVFPSSVDTLIVAIVNQVYNQSTATVIPITVLITVWSAGRGVLAITSGLNCVFHCPETRNYIYLRIRAALYTVIFIVVIVLLLLLSVFGNAISIFIGNHFELLKAPVDWLMDKRIIISPAVLMIFSLLIYKFLPNRKEQWKKQIPGSLFTAVGWLVVSWVFSVYVDIFRGFSSMYGSLTTIVLFMLWLYFCMYSILVGGEINKLFSGAEKS